MAKDKGGHGSEKRGGGAMQPGASVTRTMGVRRSGIVVKPFPVEQANDGTYRSPAMGSVPVQWEDGTKGYEHPQHLAVAGGQPVASNAHAAATLASGAKSAPVPVHGGAGGRSDALAHPDPAVWQSSGNIPRGGGPAPQFNRWPSAAVNPKGTGVQSGHGPFPSNADFMAKYGGPRNHAAEQRSFNSGAREINRLKRQGK